MNNKQLHYALVLAQTKHFSKAAEKLQISQPALSKQIRALEDELGVALFDREENPLVLTPAGECFLPQARELLQKETHLKQEMNRFADGEKGRLVIGISPFRCVYHIPAVVRTLRQEFPGLQVVLKETDSAHLHKEAADGGYDFAILNLPADETLLEVRRLESESLVLAVPDALKERVVAADGDELPTVDLADCATLPFVVLSGRQELRRLFDSLCAAADIQPEIAAEVVGILTAWNLARAGVGAAILPLPLVQTDREQDGLSFYRLRHNAPIRQPAVVHRKGRPLSVYAQRAIALFTEIS